MDDDRYEHAIEAHMRTRALERHAARRMQLRVHVAAYIGVQLLLVTLWGLTTPGGFPWFVIPLVGWGIGLAVHAAAVLGEKPIDPTTGTPLDPSTGTPLDRGGG